MSSGVKSVTPENWLEQDGAAAIWVNLDMRDGTVRPTTGEDWIKSVNTIRLDPVVPIEVADLFEFAKGGLGYGYFYYPLFTLVTQQLLRVADIAIEVLFDSLAIKPKPRSLDRRIVILRERWLIDDDQYFMLDLLRYMRNSATHGSSRTIMMPTGAIRDISWVADLISNLPWPGRSSTSADG